MGRHELRLGRSVAATLALYVFASPALMGQVGYSPDKSPFRDIRKGHSLTAVAGYFGGSGGRFGIGPHNGMVYGGRYDIRTASTLQFGLSISYGALERLVVDSLVATSLRSGPVTQSVTFADISVQFNITGGKTWHRLAPFIGAVVGLAFASDTPQDITRFEFGNELYLAPTAGFRFFLSDRLHLRSEIRGIFWKLDYPAIAGNDFSEWTTSPWVHVGLGYSFSL
jgi:hypothetical protein